MNNLIKIFAVFLVMLFSAGQVSYAANNDKEKLKLAHDFLQASNSFGLFVNGLKMGATKTSLQMLSQKYKESGNKENDLTLLESCTKTKSYNNYIEKSLYRQLPLEKVKNMMVSAYAKEFSAEELKGLIKQYRSPLFKKALAGQALNPQEQKQVEKYFSSDLGKSEMQKVKLFQQELYPEINKLLSRHTEEYYKGTKQSNKIPNEDLEKQEIRAMLDSCKKELKINDNTTN